MKKIKPSDLEKQWGEDLERRGVFDKCGETHSCCNTRLDKERGNARCCWCCPHEGCDFLKNQNLEFHKV